MITVAAWVGAYLGLVVLSYAVLVVAGTADDPMAHRLLMRHATRLAHLDEEERDRVARRIITWTKLASAAMSAAILLVLVALLAWLRST